MRVFRKFGLLAVKIHNRLFYTLMTGVEYTILSVCLIAQTLAVFAAPVGINRLLQSVVIIFGSASIFINFSVTWKLAVQIPLFGHGSGSFGSYWGQQSEIYASSGIPSLHRGH